MYGSRSVLEGSKTVDFNLTEQQELLRSSAAKLCHQFTDDYWLQADEKARFPEEFYRKVASQGWLGIAMPTEFGGAGLGITEAALLLQTISESGAGFTGASSIHMNIFGLNPVVAHGTREQMERMLPPLIGGEQKACFAVTESNSGLNTLALETTAERRGSKYIVHGRKIWISTAQNCQQDAASGQNLPAHAGPQNRRPKLVLHGPRSRPD